MKSNSYSLFLAILLACLVNGNVFAATPAPCRAGVKAPQECTVIGMNQDNPHVVLDIKAGAVMPADASTDSLLNDYLEWHGRVAAGSVFSVLMPWAALHQNAN